MKRLLLFGFGVICIVAFAGAGNPGLKYSDEFSLAATATDAASTSFTLAPRLAGLRILAGAGGTDLLEDTTWPYRTAIGYQALISNTLDGPGNTASGYQALYSNTDGAGNTASGYQALYYNVTGFNNTAIGSQALFNNTSGLNTAIGSYALYANIEGNGNTACGMYALQGNNNGSLNTATGLRALCQKMWGDGNTATGCDALHYNLGGSWNTAIGHEAGYACTGDWNIYIGAKVGGTDTDSNTIRIGKPMESGAGQNRTFIAGVVENPIPAGYSPAVVGITSDGRVGTVPPESLPPGPKGDTGPQGLAGEGLVSGSLLFLVQGATPPATYVLLGSYDLNLTVSGARKTTKLTVNVYKKS